MQMVWEDRMFIIIYIEVLNLNSSVVSVACSVKFFTNYEGRLTSYGFDTKTIL